MSIKKVWNFILQKKDLTYYILFKVLDMSIAFYLNWIIVKRLSENDYGVYSILITILGLFTTFGFSWTSSSLLYFGTEEKIKYGSLNRTFWARNIILGVSYIFIAFLFLLFYKKLDNYITKPLSLYLFVWMTVKIFTDYLITYFLAIENRKLSVITSICTKLLAAILITLNIVSLKLVLIYCILSEICALIFVYKINKMDFGKFIFDKKIFKTVLSFGIWQIFGFSGIYFINFGDNLVIKHFLTLEDVGIYNVAYKMFAGMSGFAYLFSSYFAPKVTRAISVNDAWTLKEIFYRDRIYMTILLLIPHMLVFIFTEKIIVLFFGYNYIDATFPLRILILESNLRYFFVFNILIYNCFRKYSIMQSFNILQAILNIVLDILFIPKFGILGAAYGTLLSFIISTGLETIYGEVYLRNFIKSCSKTNI